MALAGSGIVVSGAAALTVAQVGPPVKLAPIKPSARPRAPRPPARASPEPDPTDAQEAPPFRGGVVEVDPLQALDPDSVGLIDESQGGFPVTLWEGTDRALVERLLPLVPGAIKSRPARKLMRRLLLSRATAPSGKVGKKSLMKLRVDRLLAMGEVDSAVKLLRLAPPQLSDEDLVRTEIESLFFQNDNPGACGKVRRVNHEYKSSYWQRAMAFCLALSEEHAKSSMIADILYERDRETSPAFFTLIDALAGDENAVVDSLRNPGGLTLAMMRAASLKLPEDVLVSASPTVLRAVALSPNVDLEVKLEAAERAEALGALSAERLGEIYAVVPFRPEELADPITVAGQNWGPRGRALVVRAAARRDGATAKAEMLRNAWELSRERGGFDVVVRVSMPILRSIRPAAELMWFAKDAAWALFATGNVDEAMAWFTLARTESQTNEEARKASIALWPLAQIADAEGRLAWDATMLRRWWETGKEGGWKAAHMKARMLFSLLESLDRPVASAQWMELLGEEKIEMTAAPDAALWHALRNASRGGRLGETVLLSLLSLAIEGSSAANPLTLNAVIGALRKVGLDKEARELAIEAAVAAGV